MCLVESHQLRDPAEVQRLLPDRRSQHTIRGDAYLQSVRNQIFRNVSLPNTDSELEWEHFRVVLPKRQGDANEKRQPGCARGFRGADLVGYPVHGPAHVHPKSQEEQRDPPRSPAESKQLIPSTPEAKNLPKQKTRPGRSDYT